MVPLCFLTVVALGVTGAPLAHADTLFTPATYPRVDGSTATQPLGVAFQSLFTGTNVASGDVVFNQTDQAYHNLINGDADLILVTSPSQDELTAAAAAGVQLEVIPVVDEGFVFLTNADNPVTSLTVTQLRDIYSGKITNWNAVGGPDLPITAYQRQENSGSQTGMQDLVMGDTPMMDAPTLQVLTMVGLVDDVAASFSGNSGSLGYSYYYFVTQMYGDLASNPQLSKIKLMGVDDVQPTPETIRSGDYPLHTAYYIVINKADAADSPARQLADAMLSHEAQQAALDAGYVPVDTSIPLPTPTPPDPNGLTGLDETYAVNPLTFTTSTEYIQGLVSCIAVDRLTVSGLVNTSIQASINARFRAMQNSVGQLLYTLPNSGTAVDEDTSGALPVTCVGVRWVDAQGNEVPRGAGATPDYADAALATQFSVALTATVGANFSNVLSLQTVLMVSPLGPRPSDFLNVRLDTGDDLTLADVFTNGANIGGMIQLEAQESIRSCDEICANGVATRYRDDPALPFSFSVSSAIANVVTIPFASYWPQVAIFKKYASATGLYTAASPASCPVITSQWDAAHQACVPTHYQVADFGRVDVPANGGDTTFTLPVDDDERWFILDNDACYGYIQTTGVTPNFGSGPTAITIAATKNDTGSPIVTWICAMAVAPTTSIATVGMVSVHQDLPDPTPTPTPTPTSSTTTLSATSTVRAPADNAVPAGGHVADSSAVLGLSTLAMAVGAVAGLRRVH